MTIFGFQTISLFSTLLLHHFEDDLTMSDADGSLRDTRSDEEAVTIRDDVSRILLEKRNTLGILTYVPVNKPSGSS